MISYLLQRVFELPEVHLLEIGGAFPEDSDQVDHGDHLICYEPELPGEYHELVETQDHGLVLDVVECVGLVLVGSLAEVLEDQSQQLFNFMLGELFITN